MFCKKYNVARRDAESKTEKLAVPHHPVLYNAALLENKLLHKRKTAWPAVSRETAVNQIKHFKFSSRWQPNLLTGSKPTDQ